MNLFETKHCRNCGKPITLIPFVGWAHVNVLDNLDCEAQG